MASDSEPRKFFWGPLEAPSLPEVTFPGEKKPVMTQMELKLTNINERKVKLRLRNSEL